MNMAPYLELCQVSDDVFIIRVVWPRIADSVLRSKSHVCGKKYYGETLEDLRILNVLQSKYISFRN